MIKDANYKGRTPKSKNKLCEEALAIFDKFEEQYNYQPLADLIELSMKLKVDINTNGVSGDTQRHLVQQYRQTLESVLKYRHPQLKAICIDEDAKKATNMFMELLTEALKKSSQEESK